MSAQPDKEMLQEWFTSLTTFVSNRFHPLVWIVGEPQIGEGVYIGGFSEVNAKDANVKIGAHCDIASFVTINCADSHKKCIGLCDEVERKDITIEHNVFVGSHTVIKGGAHIGHHSVVAAGTVVGPSRVPPFSLVVGNPAVIKPGYYLNQAQSSDNSA